MKRILVTGAAGFIGSHLVRALLEAGYAVRALDNLSTGQFGRLAEHRSRIEWLLGDVCDPHTAERAVDGIDAVLHQAAIPSVSRSLADPLATNRANVLGTLTLLEACRRSGARRLVLAASSSAYGNSPTLPRIETMPAEPLSPYAVSKVAAEQYCAAYARLGYVETVALRYFNVFGPGQDPNSQYAAVVPRFCVDLLAGRPVTIFGDGTQSRDFTHVENVVRANLLALEAPGVSGELFNIGCGRSYSLNELVGELGRALRIRPDVRHAPARAGDVAHSLADIGKARRLLGYTPAVSFREGIARTAAWYRQQELRPAETPRRRAARPRPRPVVELT